MIKTILALSALTLASAAFADGGNLGFGWGMAATTCTPTNPNTNQGKTVITIYTSMEDPSGKAMIGITDGVPGHAMVIEATLKLSGPDSKMVAEYSMAPMAVEMKATRLVLDYAAMTATLSNADGSALTALTCKVTGAS